MRHRNNTFSAHTSRCAGMERHLAHGFGSVLINALHDPAVIEIMVNADGRLWLERLESGVENTGIIVKSGYVKRLLRSLASLRGLSVSAATPILECELPGYGARVEGILPPISRAPIVAIRKHRSLMYSLEDYRGAGGLSVDQAEALRECIRQRRNIVVCGTSSSGKTTLANALLLEKLRLGSPSQRIVILQDRLEFRWCGENVVSLRTSESADLPRLLRATFHLRPDTIVVGEVRGREALEMLKAWSSGQPGGITTLNANDVGAALSRLNTLVQEAGVPSQPTLVGEAVDCVVAMHRTATRRVVREVVRVEGYDEVNGYRLREI
jgi:type IV secretion system protein VirB11